MKFHAVSFALGGATVLILGATRERLRPVVVELMSLAVHFGRISAAAFERKREDLEDLWAEVEGRVKWRARGGATRARSNGDARTNIPQPAAPKAH